MATYVLIHGAGGPRGSCSVETTACFRPPFSPRHPRAPGHHAGRDRQRTHPRPQPSEVACRLSRGVPAFDRRRRALMAGRCGWMGDAYETVSACDTAWTRRSSSPRSAHTEDGHLWSRAVATSGNRWQMHPSRNPHAEVVADPRTARLWFEEPIGVSRSRRALGAGWRRTRPAGRTSRTRRRGSRRGGWGRSRLLLPVAPRPRARRGG
jgi:hypothetical protein